MLLDSGVPWFDSILHGVGAIDETNHMGLHKAMFGKLFLEVGGTSFIVQTLSTLAVAY